MQKILIVEYNAAFIMFFLPFCRHQILSQGKMPEHRLPRRRAFRLPHCRAFRLLRRRALSR